jgi:hypothetical protein
MNLMYANLVYVLSFFIFIQAHARDAGSVTARMFLFM